jgi:hypothetical protein
MMLPAIYLDNLRKTMADGNFRVQCLDHLHSPSHNAIDYYSDFIEFESQRNTNYRANIFVALC